MRLRPLIAFALIAAASSAAAQPARKARPGPELRGAFSASVQTRDENRVQAEAARRDIERLQAELDEIRALDAASRRMGGDRRARLAAINARDTALALEAGRNQTELARLLGALQSFRRHPPPALLIPASEAQDAIRAAILIRAMQPELAARARAYGARADRIRLLRRAVAAASADLFEGDSAVAERRAELERMIVAARASERAATRDAVLAGRDVDTLAAELRALGLALPARPAEPRAPTTMLAPVDGRLTARFGQPMTGGRASRGFVWTTGPAAEVRAPAGGVVEYAGPLSGWDGVMILRLGGGYRVVLAGLDRMLPASSRTVAAGQVVGRMAEHGPRAPELYLEIRRGDDPVDPARWLRPSSLARAPSLHARIYRL